MAGPEKSPLPRAVQKLEGVGSYVEEREKPREYITRTNVSEGMSPFGPPPEYKEILNELVASGLLYDSGVKYPGKLNLEPAIENIRERHELSYDSDVVVGFAGSNELLERIAMTFRKGTLVFGIGPHFTGFHKSLKAINKSIYGPISPPLTQPLEEVLESNMPSPTRFPRKPDVLYLAVPDARGDDADSDLLWEFTDRWADKGVLVVLDRALADFTPDSNHTHPNLVEVRSFSKAMGLPGDGFSYAMGGEEFIKILKKHSKEYGYRGKTAFMAELFNRVSSLEIVEPHLKMVREKTSRVERKMLSALVHYGIKYLPTDETTPLLFVDGESERFFDNLDLPATPGSGFYYTYDPHTLTPLTNRYARIGLPFLNYEDTNLDIDCQIDLIAKRISGAIHVVKQYDLQSRPTL